LRARAGELDGDDVIVVTTYLPTAAAASVAPPADRTMFALNVGQVPAGILAPPSGDDGEAVAGSAVN
jgi:hypothetical protein